MLFLREDPLLSTIAVDFACGIGGTSSGFQQADIDVVKGVDIDPSCRETYEENCYPSRFVEADIRSVKLATLMADIERRPSDRLLFSACLPCQPFSKQGKLDERDERIPLALAFLRLVRQQKPDLVFSENVPGFETALGGNLSREFIGGLEKLGYKCAYRVIDARDYGLAQMRRRFILLASLSDMPAFPARTHGEGSQRYASVRDEIADYPAIAAGERDPDVPNHEAMRLTEKNLRRIRCTPKDGGGRDSWPRNLVLECHKSPGTVYSDVYGRMRWDGQAPTLTTRCLSLSNGRFGHPDQDRAISLREAAALQGFDDSFVFQAPLSVSSRHVGNAVPPLLAQALGRSLVH